MTVLIFEKTDMAESGKRLCCLWTGGCGKIFDQW